MVQAVTGERARLLVEGLAKLHLSFSQGQVQSAHRRRSYAQTGPFAAAPGAGNRRGRNGAEYWCRPAAGQATASARRQGALGKGGEENEKSQGTQIGRLVTSPSAARTLGSFGVQRSWASPLLNSKPSEWTPPRPPFRLRCGQNTAVTMLAIAHATGAKSIDPAFRHRRQVIGMGDREYGSQIWSPCRLRCEESLPGSAASRGVGAGATDAAAIFVLTLLRLGWSAQSARHLSTHDGTKVDLLGVAPQTVDFWVDQATLIWTDSSAHWRRGGGAQKAHSSGKPSDLCSRLVGWRAGPYGQAGFLEASGRRTGYPDSWVGTTTFANYAEKGQARCSTTATRCLALQGERDMPTSQEFAAGGGLARGPL